MLCQECNERPATVHVTRVLNGQKQESFLCEICAKEKGELGLLVEPKFLLHQLLAGILGAGISGPNQEPAAQTGGECATCGMTYQEFSKGGRLGCPDCYQSFSDNLDLLFKRVHGTAIHTGKVPRRAGGAVRLKRELAELRRRLVANVEREEFEEAAIIRDQIREREIQLGRPQGAVAPKGSTESTLGQEEG